jgi:Uma2 family endonuclease
MSRERFHALYRAGEGLERIELIEGVVFLPSPIKVQGHGHEHGLMIEWLSAYAARNPGRAVWSPPVTLLLDDDNEPEPDALLYRPDGARFRDGFLATPPELIVEIAASSVSRDLHQKKRAYQRNGVREYIVWRTLDRQIDWFQLRDGAYVQRAPDADGLIAGETFPGLRLDVAAMLAGDRARVLAALQV